MIGAHEPVIAGLHQDVGLRVGVMARMQVRAADPTAR